MTLITSEGLSAKVKARRRRGQGDAGSNLSTFEPPYPSLQTRSSGTGR